MSADPTAAERPTLFCFDGSEGSLAALRAASLRLRPGPAVVLTVWETVALRVARRAFAGGVTVANEEELDAGEEEAGRAAADEGARSAREHGWEAQPRLARVDITEWRTIVDIADEIDAGLIVCGTRGLGGCAGWCSAGSRTPCSSTPAGRSWSRPRPRSAGP